VSGADAFATLSEYLRGPLGLTGTKIVCSEGDCGACSVLVGRPRGGRLEYAAIDSCIQFMHQLDRTHVVTVEGISCGDRLHPVQEAMAAGHGSQCGFCTPGIVMAMTGCFETCGEKRTERLGEQELRYALSGNLCRCTGYVQIFESGAAVDPASVAPMREMYPEKEMLAAFARESGRQVRIEAAHGARQRTLCIPSTMAEAAAFRAEKPNCPIVNGASDLGVQYNKGRFDPDAVLTLVGIPGLAEVGIEDGRLVWGACATWSSIERQVKELVPEFWRILTLFGSPQIRNSGTAAGNLANGSPIGDSLPFHFAMESEIEVVGKSGTRRIPIGEFFLGYKKFSMKPDELISRIIVPLPGAGDVLKLYKVSKRRDLDISGFTAAILARIEGERIESIRVSYGGVGPVVLRLPKTEAFLTGKEFAERTFAEAGEIAVQEITPISDVRGSRDFRLKLARNILRKFYFEVAGADSRTPAGVA